MMTHYPESEADIKAVMKAWADALWHKNIEKMAEGYGDNAQVYDCMRHARGKDEFIALWTPCLPYFGDHIGVEYKNTEIHAGEDTGFFFGLSRLTGADCDDDMAKSWFRVTVCFKKINGVWKTVHEHVSLPVNGETGSIAYILD